MEKQTDVNLSGGVVVVALCDGADPSVEEGGRSVPATLGDDQSPHLFLQGTAPHPMAELFSTPFPLTPLGEQPPMPQR